MEKNLAKELFKVMVMTFENLCFMLPMEKMGDIQEKANFEAAVKVEFNGLCKGKLVLILFGNLLETMTLNILGEDYNLTEEVMNDALGEVGNVICGNILPSIGESKNFFNISAPEILKKKDVDTINKKSLLAENSTGFENGRVEVMLFVEGK